MKHKKMDAKEVDVRFSYLTYKLKFLQKESTLNFDKVDSRYYYVYRITNLVNGKHYYGSRVSKLLPKDDLGIKYFSSSKYVLQDIDIYSSKNFKFKVVKIFDNNGDKVLYESYLHKYFQVSKHPLFYNRANQTPYGFDTTGNLEVSEALRKCRKGTKHSEESKRKISLSSRHRVGKLNPFFGKTHTEEVRERIRKCRIGGKGHFQGKTHTIGSRKKMSDIKLGTKNSSWKGYYIYKDLKFTTASDMYKALGIRGIVCRKLDEIITNRHYGKSNFLQNFNKEDVVGKTWRDLGFDFIDKEKEINEK